jgi:hypothetical protein
VTDARRSDERLQAIEQQRARPRRAVAHDPLDADIAVRLNRLSLGVGLDFDESPRANTARQRFDHREDRRNACFVSDKEMPVGRFGESRTTARTGGVELIARLRVLRPLRGGTMPVQHEVDRQCVVAQCANRVVATRCIRQVQHEVLAGRPRHVAQVGARELQPAHARRQLFGVFENEAP